MLEMLGDSNAAVTSDVVMQASEVARARIVALWAHTGRSFEECRLVSEFYTYVGNQIAELVGPDGRLEGATLAELYGDLTDTEVDDALA